MEDSFYPFIDFLADTNIDITEDEPLPLYREIAWDFKNDHPLVDNNEFKKRWMKGVRNDLFYIRPSFWA